MEVKFKTISDLITNTPNTFKNCNATDRNLGDMTQWMSVLSGFVQVKGLDNATLDMQEKRLDTFLPAEIRVLYKNIGGSIDELTKENLKFQKFQLLNITSFWIEKDVVVKDYYTGECWFKTDVLVYATTKNIKTPVYGIDLKNGWCLSYDKDWIWQKDDMPLFQKLIMLFANMIILNKENVIKTKVKGMIGVKRDEKAEKKFEAVLTRLPGFEYYEHTIFYNHTLDLIGWFRAGNTPDFLVGSNSKINLSSLITQFDFSSARFLKNGDK